MTMYPCGCNADEHFPCETHLDILVAREGASLRTADELRLQFIEDAVDWAAETDEPIELSPWGQETVDRSERGIATGDRWLPGHLSDDLETLVNEVENEVGMRGLSVFWDDGYLIYRCNGGPLAEEEVSA